MQTAEFNHNDFSDTAEADKALMVRFFYKNVQNKLESEAQGRPVFKEKTYIEIRIAGQRDIQACRPITHQDKVRFPRHFEAFEKRMEPPTEGMPLAEWPKITRTQAEELSFMNVKTVEQLAGMKDSNISNFMGGHKLREDAKKWLEHTETLAEDTEKEEMRQTIAELKAAVAALTEAAKSPAPEDDTPAPELKSELDDTPDKETDVNAAVPVPAAPGAVKPRRGRKKD